MPLQILPSIDLRGGRVVRLKQGDYGRQVTYDVDPFQTARSFKEAGAKWMHVVDLDGAKEGRPVQTQLLSDLIGQSGLQVEVGGGVRDTGDINRLLDAGAARVVVGTKAFEDWDWFQSLISTPGFEQKIVLAIDARDGVIATRGWTHTAGRLAVDVAREVATLPVAALLYTDVARDGMLMGPNLHHTRLLVEAGPIPVIASGGVGNIDHVRQVMKIGAWGIIIGRSLYEGTVDLSEAVKVAQG